MYDDDWDLYTYNGSDALELAFELDHVWVEVLLLNMKVWDCVHCKAHKEKVELGEHPPHL